MSHATQDIQSSGLKKHRGRTRGQIRGSPRRTESTQNLVKQSLLIVSAKWFASCHGTRGHRSGLVFGARVEEVVHKLGLEGAILGDPVAEEVKARFRMKVDPWKGSPW